eukprot:scaffold6280_cov127-Skeletonema_marinoi.AAC.10
MLANCPLARSLHLHYANASKRHPSKARSLRYANTSKRHPSKNIPSTSLEVIVVVVRIHRPLQL